MADGADNNATFTRSGRQWHKVTVQMDLRDIVRHVADLFNYDINIVIT